MTRKAYIITRRYRTDWFRILADLERCGVSNRQAAQRINVAPETLRRWKTGSHPRFDDGAALINLWLATIKQAQLHSSYDFVAGTTTS